MAPKVHVRQQLQVSQQFTSTPPTKFSSLKSKLQLRKQPNRIRERRARRVASPRSPNKEKSQARKERVLIPKARLAQKRREPIL